MHQQPPHGTALTATAALLALTAGCASQRPAVLDATPAALRPPQEQHLAIASHGVGFQIYECRAGKTDPASFAWTFKAPEARLRYVAGKDLGKHYAGPTWEANDGSSVVGEVVAHEEGPEADAIPWLLLRAKSTAGSGVFSGVTFIQRLRTSGGKAPTTGCDAGYAGTEVRVAYSADYYFYTTQP